MRDLRERWQQDPWTLAALALGLVLCVLACADVFFWHTGYAYGDETDVIARVQRIREGAPWDFTQGCLHRSLLLASMSLWPGQLWATSVPALGALALEGLLLFALGRRVGGPRAGFFAMLAGLASAFTLVRSRSALSFALFPAEFLAIVWLRLQCSKPWQWALWGAALGLLTLEYEAFIPVAALLFVAPFPSDLPWRQRGWELAGIGLLLLATFDPAHLHHYFERRKVASLAQAGSPSAGLAGLGGLILGGPAMPYLAPVEHGVLPLWYWLVLPFGLAAWSRRLWVPLAYLGLGLALPLMGGAPYGLPAHRMIAAWPVLALVTGMGLERLMGFAEGRTARAVLVAGLALVVVTEVRAWQHNQALMDATFRGPVRDLQRAAQAGWTESQRRGLPLVTELHPMQGAQFRFLTGHAVPLPDAKATTIVAFLQWEYLPAVRKHFGPVLNFREEAGLAPTRLALLDGALARQALEAELSFRPLLIQTTQYTVDSSQVILGWLRQHPKAGPWARTLAVDYLLTLGWYLGCLEEAWVKDAQREPLVSSHPLVVVADAVALSHPEQSLALARQARSLDPHNTKAWQSERRALEKLGRQKEIEALDRDMQALDSQNLLFND
jgi:hypothetical protein